MHLRKKLCILLVFVMFIISVIIGLCLRKGTTNFSFINTPDAVDRIRIAEKRGESVELQEEDINSILGVYIGQGRNKGSVTVKGIKTAFKEETLSLEIPIIYKGVHLLISTSGKCTYLNNENKIEYKPSFYKLGSMPVPRRIVQSILRKHENKDFEVTNSSVKVYLSMFPSSMKGATINKNNVEVSLDKNDSLATIFPKLSDKSSSEEELSVVSTGKPSSNIKKTDNLPSKTDPKEMKSSLSKINSDLSKASLTLKSAEEKEVLKRIMKTIKCVSENLDYNYASDVSQVTSLYKNLTTEGRNRINLAIMSSVNMDTATKIKNTFSL